ncbi:metallophosphoesterase [Bradyrhizobium sp. NBAIM20]|uniref:metallophosphoesterase n=1 Tax=unclassified Bradyrhizobium TaxID=2631580 RepID=UPI001CD204DA|nr:MULTISPECIES: metallophosphoesterase [unclassified Bradyrhizobium]MCA1411717.1 metallophosphoesterase [Bradyrhizobium sp. NBAIM20]MCA1460948.1 metallophosphoesterase [Bradyrhizobium sp. NBAIM18]
MRLWIMSDIHLELTRGWDLPTAEQRPDFDVLIIAGDLVPKAERGVKWLMERVPDRHVIYVMGNHEAYGEDIDRTLEKAKEAAAGTNVHVLENESVRIGNVIFAGATLWTDFALHGDAHGAMALAADRMNDFRKIRINHYRQRFLPHHAVARHFKSVAFLQEEMRKQRGADRLVVATHHAPVRQISEAPRPGSDHALDPAYRSDLTRLMEPAPDDGRGALRPADLWVFAHTHESFDAVIGQTRAVSNAKGYGPWPPRDRAWDNPNFNEKLIIEI